MDIHFYITPSDLERYNKEGACYVTNSKLSKPNLLHISFSLSNHTIEKTTGGTGEFILRKVNWFPKIFYIFLQKNNLPIYHV